MGWPIQLLFAISLGLFGASINGKAPASKHYMDGVAQKLQDTYWTRWYRTHTSKSHRDIEGELQTWQHFDQIFRHDANDPLTLEEREKQRWEGENRPEGTIFTQPTAEVWQVLPLHSESTGSPISQ